MPPTEPPSTPAPTSAGHPRILVDLSVAPPGGAATYADGFAAGMAAWGDPSLRQVVVVVDAGWAEEHRERVEGVRATGATVVVQAFPPPGSWAARLGRGRTLKRIARQQGVDVAFFPRDVGPRLPIPVVVLVNNLYAWRRYGTGGAIGGRVPAFLLRVMARRSVARAAAVLAVSRSMADAVEGAETVAIVHHGCLHPEHLRPVDPAPDGGAERPLVVTVVGNLIENKGTEVVLRGVAGASGGPWDLRVYGNRMDPAYADRVEALSFEVFGRSVLLGPAYGPDLVAAYQHADVVVVGGTFESFCYPLVEAMRAGAVVVAPASDLVSELCGDVAVTYREGDAASLARALELAAAERQVRSARGVERSREYLWPATVERTLALVRAAVPA
jgi:glycosyltransferase involved in cell wall biosynthesis